MHGIDKEEMARQARNEYQREWRKANKDKVKEYNKRYWNKKYKEFKETKEDE